MRLELCRPGIWSATADGGSVATVEKTDGDVFAGCSGTGPLSGLIVVDGLGVDYGP